MPWSPISRMQVVLWPASTLPPILFTAWKTQNIDLFGVIVWKFEVTFCRKIEFETIGPAAVVAAARVTSYFETVCIAIIHHPPPPQILLHLFNKYSYFQTNKSIWDFLKERKREHLRQTFVYCSTLRAQSAVKLQLRIFMGGRKDAACGHILRNDKFWGKII